MKDAASRSQHVLVRVEDAAVGVGERILFEGVNIDLREGEAVELRGRNGAGKTTLIRMLLASGDVARPSRKHLFPQAGAPPIDSAGALGAPLPERQSLQKKSLTSQLEYTQKKSETPLAPNALTAAPSAQERGAAVAPILYSGNLFLDPQVRVGVYEQEIDERYLADPLEAAIEKLYLSHDLPISDTKIRQLLADYLFTEADRMTPLARLSGGQKARFQIIAMLANDPQLLILDEPTSGVDPAARAMFWRTLLKLSRQDRITIFVTTHFMNEVERCDRISLMHRGRVLAMGTPAELVQQSGQPNMEEAFIYYLEQDAAATGKMV